MTRPACLSAPDWPPQGDAGSSAPLYYFAAESAALASTQAGAAPVDLVGEADAADAAPRAPASLSAGGRYAAFVTAESDSALTVREVDAAGGRSEFSKSIDVGQRIRDLAFSPRAPEILAVLTDAPYFEILLLDVASGEHLCTSPPPKGGRIAPYASNIRWHPFRPDFLVAYGARLGADSFLWQWIQKLDEHVLYPQNLVWKSTLLDTAASATKPHEHATPFYPLDFAFDANAVYALTTAHKVLRFSFVDLGGGTVFADLAEFAAHSPSPLSALEVAEHALVVGDEAGALRVFTSPAAAAEGRWELSETLQPFRSAVAWIRGSRGAAAFHAGSARGGIVRWEEATGVLQQVAEESDAAVILETGLLSDVPAADAEAETGRDESETATEQRAAESAEEERHGDAAAEMDPRHASLHEALGGVRRKLAALVAANAERPAAEQLPASALVLDLAERDRMTREAQAQVQALQEELELDNLRHRILRDRLRSHCVDSMEVVPQTIVGLSSSSAPAAGAPEVSNFALPHADTSQRLAHIAARRAEVERGELLRKHGAAADVLGHTGSGEQELLVPQYATELGDPQLAPLLYDTCQLAAPERRAVQVSLLEALAESVMRGFNGRFRLALSAKIKEVARIEDKSERVRALVEELGLPDGVYRPQLDEREDLERVLAVTDAEVTAPRVLSAEELRRQAEAARLEAERRAAAAADNMRDRALGAMMGGTLAEKADLEVKAKELPRPEFMLHKTPKDYTDDEKRQAKDFDRRLLAHREEAEKHKKSLEAELRKLQEAIDEICAGWNAQLRALHEERLAHEHAALYYRVQVAKLRQLSYLETSEEQRKPVLVQRIQSCEEAHKAATDEIPYFREQMDLARDEHERAVKAERESERAFKKHFTELHEHHALIARLFRSRTLPLPREAYGLASSRPHTASARVAVASNMSGAALPAERAEGGAADAPDELQRSRDFPYELEEDSWRKLVELRARRFRAEADVQSTAQRFAERQEIVNKLSVIAEKVGHQLESALQEWERWNAATATRKFDMEALLTLKQGQIEVKAQPVVTDYSGCSLIDRSAVEQLNERIKVLGAAKVDALREIKDYRKGIHELNWESKMLDFQAETLALKIRDIQLLRVTKDMQEYIRSGKDDTKHASTIAMLEKRLEHSAATHVQKTASKEKQRAKLEADLQALLQKTAQLSAESDLLQAEVAGRQAEASQSSAKHENRQAQDTQLLRVIRDRRKYKDLTDEQAREIAALAAELEKLRRRTVPMFTSVYRD